MKCAGNVLASANEINSVTQRLNQAKNLYLFFSLFNLAFALCTAFSMTASIHGILVCVTFELFRSVEDIIYGNLLPVSKIQINIQPATNPPTPCNSTDLSETLFLLWWMFARFTNNVRPNICRFVRVRWNWLCQYPMENTEINTRFFRVKIKAFDTIFHLSLTFRINSFKRTIKVRNTASHHNPRWWMTNSSWAFE